MKGYLSALAVIVMAMGCATSTPVSPSRPVPSIMPVAYSGCVISSAFGGRDGGGHNGVDLVAPKGTCVMAAADGQVIFCGRITGYGRIIKIAHANGIETWYAHLKSRDTKVGRTVAQGQVIGKVGNSGRSHGAHLHYEVRVNGRPVDPKKYL